MSTATQHKRGTRGKPGALQLIVPAQVVTVVGRTIRGKDNLYRVKLATGQILEVMPDWLGGHDLAGRAWEETQHSVYRDQEAARAAQAARERAARLVANGSSAAPRPPVRRETAIAKVMRLVRP